MRLSMLCIVQGEYVLRVSLLLVQIRLGVVLPLLERLFGVKGHDCCLWCLLFRK